MKYKVTQCAVDKHIQKQKSLYLGRLHSMREGNIGKIIHVMIDV